MLQAPDHVWEGGRDRPRTAYGAILEVAGKRLVHGGAGAEIEEILGRPDAVLRSGPETGQNGSIDGVGVLLHGRSMRQKYFDVF